MADLKALLKAYVMAEVKDMEKVELMALNWVL